MRCVWSGSDPLLFAQAEVIDVRVLFNPQEDGTGDGRESMAFPFVALAKMPNTTVTWLDTLEDKCVITTDRKDNTALVVVESRTKV